MKVLTIDLDVEIETLVEILVHEDSPSEPEKEPRMMIPQTLQQKSKKIQKRVRKTPSRKPPYKPATIPSIRILRRDIRRKYLEMILNVMNVHDERYFHSFVNQFFTIQSTIIESFPEQPEPANRMIMKGIEAMKTIYSVNFYMMPDAVLRMLNAKIYQRLHEKGSRIIALVRMEGTVLHVAKNLPLTLEKVTSQQGQQNPQKKCDVPVLIDPNEFHVIPEPIKIGMDGILTIILDEWNQFAQMEFNFSGFKNPWMIEQ